MSFFMRPRLKMFTSQPGPSCSDLWWSLGTVWMVGFMVSAFRLLKIIQHFRIFQTCSGWCYGTCFFDFPYIGNVTNPTDELIFRGVGLNHQPVLHHFTGNWHLDIWARKQGWPRSTGAGDPPFFSIAFCGCRSASSSHVIGFYVCTCIDIGLFDCGDV